MKQLLSGLPVLVLFLAMLFSPKAVFEGAESGLLLWFQVVFPTLFPFMLVSGLMLSGGGLVVISRIFGRLFSTLFATSPNGSFAVIAGFLCGYPMGAKVSADLVRSGRISRDEGAYLLSFCNNTSPIFIMNFIVWKTFDREELMIPTLLILIGVPAFLSLFFRRFYLKGRKKFPDLSDKKKNNVKLLNFEMLDSCLADSFESIVKVGLYIIFFSILIALPGKLSAGHPLLAGILPVLEMTNGILMIHKAAPDLTVSYPLILGLTSFGGFCSAAQTKCMLKAASLPILPYIIQKLTAAAAASLLGIVYMHVF
ncbi:transporter [Mediterraneibacter glycyrrhizinilyticus]|uniref:transporter n=1 Tax=Mediterraneibacter glycyrrhizinilyticus TaxID=342942 RepID=UPI0025A3A482|nr:transporter [Mediterraneibacter glycyrrhizinilyticus]MDM8124761.1 transporter [Mediterraneibacter glycyrrhizinilyticus]